MPTVQGKQKFDRPLMRRFYDINTPTLNNISMDIEHMPPSKSPYKYILVLLCDISNFLVATVVLLHCGCLSLNPFIEFSIRNNSSSLDVLNIQASISICPKFESK